MHKGDSLDAVQIIPPGLINKQAVIGTRYKCDPELTQGTNALATPRAERPPAFERSVTGCPREHDRNILVECKTSREGLDTRIARFAVMALNHAVQGQTHGGSAEGRGPTGTV